MKLVLSNICKITIVVTLMLELASSALDSGCIYGYVHLHNRSRRAKRFHVCMLMVSGRMLLFLH